PSHRGSRPDRPGQEPTEPAILLRSWAIPGGEMFPLFFTLTVGAFWLSVLYSRRAKRSPQALRFLISAGLFVYLACLAYVLSIAFLGKADPSFRRPELSPGEE